MKRALTMTLALFSAISLARAARAEDGSATTDLGAEARYVHDTPQGPTQGFVRMYDVDRYDIGEFDAFAHTGWDSALLNVNANDIRSTQENGNLDFSWGSAVILKGSLDIIGMRSPLERSGNVVDNVFNPNTNYVDETGGVGTEADFFRRYFQDEEITFSLPSHPEYRVFLANWLVQDRGDRAVSDSGGSDSKVFNLSIDRFTRENTFGIDLDIGQNAQAYYEYAYRKFVDYAQTPTNLSVLPISSLNVPDQDVDTNKVAFRSNPSTSLSLAGSAITRVRTNHDSDYTQHNYSGNLSAMYRESKDLSFSARLYGNSYQVSTNNSWLYYGNGGLGTAPNDIDFLFLKGDFTMRYSGLNNAVFTAAYKPEMTRRSGAPNWTQSYSNTSGGPIVYQNLTLPQINSQSQGPALQDDKNTFEAGLAFMLPHEVELDLHEKYMYADVAAYENSPTLDNEHNVGVTVPLPQNMFWMGDFTDSRSQNQRSNLTDFQSTNDRFMTGLNWNEAKGRGSLGIFYTFEDGTDTIDAWYGTSNVARGGNTVSPLINEPNAPYNYTNHVLSVTATAKPVERLNLTGDLSFTNSAGTFLTSQVFDPYFTGAAAGSSFEAFNPTDLQIVRFGINARYEVNKWIALRGGYRHEAWVDREDSLNDGRDDIYNLGVSAKF
jgi:hypothetical protein